MKKPEEKVNKCAEMDATAAEIRRLTKELADNQRQLSKAIRPKRPPSQRAKGQAVRRQKAH